MTGGSDDKRPPVRGAFGVADTTRSADVPADPDPPRGPEPSASIGTWGGLRLIEELGRGSFGRVYRAWDDTLAREVALKVIPLPRPDAELANVYLREGRMLARVRHQNVVPVYGALHLGDEIGLWMELIRGRRLADIVREDGPLSADEAAVVGVSLCHALSAVHGAGVLHRDLKAHNVMREEGGRIVLMDFGAGRDAATAPGAGDYSGTPLYMAPEILAGRAASMASDVYSLGVLLYFLVTGAYPIEGRDATEIATAHGLGRRVRLVDRRPDLPDEFVRVVERALEPSLQSRYPTAGVMLAELAGAVAGLSPERRAALLPRSEQQTIAGQFAAAHPPRRISAVFWIAASVAVAIGIAFLGFLTSAAFDATLGRDASFVGESLLIRLSYGLNAIVAPAVYAAVLVVLGRVAVAAVRSASRLFPALGRLLRRNRARLANAARHAGLDDGRVIALWIVCLQAIALGLVLWAFADLLWALMSFVNDAEPPKLTILRWRNLLHLGYRVTLSILVTSMALVWWKLLTTPRGRAPERATTVAGLLLIGIAVAMLVVPYRLLFKNQFVRAEYAGQRCYVIGQRPRDTARDLLLFCPDSAPPRNHIVPADDPQLRRTGVAESIFTPPDAAPR